MVKPRVQERQKWSRITLEFLSLEKMAILPKIGNFVKKSG